MSVLYRWQHHWPPQAGRAILAAKGSPKQSPPDDATVSPAKPVNSSKPSKKSSVTTISDNSNSFSSSSSFIISSKSSLLSDFTLKSVVTSSSSASDVDDETCFVKGCWEESSAVTVCGDNGFCLVEHNGGILPEELWEALVRAGIKIDDEELAHFVERVDKDHNGVITFEEWRDFLLLYPHEATIENIYHYLERICMVDIGEHTVIPAGVGKHVHAYRYLIAGGVAGAASRTATAPLDRLKVVLQVQTTSARIMPAVKTLWKEGGLVGFFRGNGLNVLKVAPESAIRFYTYEMMKTFIVDAKGGEEKADIGGMGRLLAGGIAGAVAQTVIYPMDLVKTRLQTYTHASGKIPSLGTLSKDIWVQEGPRAFYRGLIPSIVGIIPYAGIDLAAYETLKEMSKKYIIQEGEPGPLVQLGCGTVSGALGATCVYPLQVVRTRMQAQSSYKGMADVFRKTLKHEGFRGFYKGIFPNLLKVVPSASITYMVYESMKKSLDLE